MFIKNIGMDKSGIRDFSIYLILAFLFLTVITSGCTRKANLQNHSRSPLAVYEINYKALSHTMSIKSIDITPPSAGQNITGKAGLFQAGNAVFDGAAVTAPVFITNNDTDDWTGVVMQAYSLRSGNAGVCDADLGEGWYVNNPDNGAWGWIFTSGTSGSEFTIPIGGDSAITHMGFNATSDFISLVYIYEGAPIITDVEPADAPSGATVTLTGYNFSTTQGVVTINGITATVQKWEDKDIEVTVPDSGLSGDVIVHTNDRDTAYSNPFMCPRYKVSIDCSTPGPNPVNAGSSMTCTIYATGGRPSINKAIDTCGGSIGSGGYCGENWTYNFSSFAGQSGTCTAAVINGTATAQNIITISAVSPWPKFRANMRNTGLSTVNTSGVTGVLQWWSVQEMSIGMWASPVIGTDGTIYLADGPLCAFKPDGTLIWCTNPPGLPPSENSYSTPVISPDGTIYVGSSDNNLYAINPDGSQKWSIHAGGKLAFSSPAIGSDGTIYIGSWDHNLYAINPGGTLKWTYATGNDIDSSPAIGLDGTIYIESTDGNLYAVNPDGSLRWSFATGNYVNTAPNSSPAIGSDGTIYIGSTNDNLYAVNPDGSAKWNFHTGGYIQSSPAIGADGTIYVGSRDDRIYAINPDGTLKWKYATGGMVGSSPAIGLDGTIYVGSWDGKVYAINADGSLKWNYFDGVRWGTSGYVSIASSPAIGSDGTIYLGIDGSLYAFH